MATQTPNLRSPAAPHAGQPVLTAGPAPEDAAATLILIHGRGASAQSILQLHDALGVPNVAALAPQAAGHTWYPYSFLAPLDANQPYLDSALDRIESLVADVVARRSPAERVALLGFSQGACLVSEFVARHARRYGAVMVLTGGLIGPDGTPRDYVGSLAGTPVFLATSDPDPHVPLARVEETGRVLVGLGATVDLRVYPGMPHTINEEEIAACRDLLRTVATT